MATRGRMTALDVRVPVARGRMTSLTLVSPIYTRGRMTGITISPAPAYDVSLVMYTVKYSPFDIVPLTLAVIGDSPPDSVDWSRIRGFTASGGTPSTMPQNSPSATKWPNAWVDEASAFATARTPLTFLGSGVTQSFKMPGRTWEPAFYVRWVAHKAGYPDISGEARIDGLPHAGYYDPTGVIGYEYIAF